MTITHRKRSPDRGRVGDGRNMLGTSVVTIVLGSTIMMLGLSWEGVAVSIQVRHLGLMLILCALVGSIWVGKPLHIKTTLDLSFLHVITLKLFCILRVQVILKVGNWVGA